MTPRDLESTLGTHFHARHGTKTNPGFLLADAEVSWLLLPSQISLLLGSTVQPENTFLYLQGDRSGQRKPKEDKHQH